MLFLPVLFKSYYVTVYKSSNDYLIFSTGQSGKGETKQYFKAVLTVLQCKITCYHFSYQGIFTCLFPTILKRLRDRRHRKPEHVGPG